MPTGNAELRLDQYVRINVGLNPLILQAHRDRVRIIHNDSRPAKGSAAFHVLNGGEPPYYLKSIDTNIWVLALTDTSSLTVTELKGPEAGVNPIDTITELAMMLHEQLSIIASNQGAQLHQLSMLNLRIEEAFETDLDEDYLNEHSN
jgi:hypothetical protein